MEDRLPSPMIFFTDENEEYQELTKFAEHVTDLRVNVYHENIVTLRSTIQQFHNSEKLYVYNEGFLEPQDLIIPQVRHYIFHANRFQNTFQYFELYRLSCICKFTNIRIKT